ncbi:zinc ABC transporter substrate-binding protein [Shimia sp. W99]
MSRFARFFPALLAWPVFAQAEVPKVVTDIAPVQSLVAGVMHGVGTPKLLIRPGTSPHDYAMRPSEARALQEANLVIWIGPELTPSLEETIGTLAGSAVQITLLDVNDTRRLSFRDGVIFDHDSEEEHSEHGDDEHEAHDDHDAHGSEDAHDHDHDGLDPHAWLDPVNAQVWVHAIAAQLSEMDPGNAAIYDGNAATLSADLVALTEEIRARLEPVGDRRFVVFHDAYQYFETRFGLHLTGALLHSDGAPPSAGRLRALHEELEHEQVHCIFTEPQFDPKIVAAISENGEIPVAELDPIGVGLDEGSGLYQRLIIRMGEQFATCLEPKG